MAQRTVFTPDEVWNVAEATIKRTRRVLLYGPPGTGKTTTAQMGALEDGEDVFPITCTEEMLANVLIGSWMPQPTPSGAPALVWRDGLAVAAWRKSHEGPARLVLNEIDRAGPDLLSAIYVIADDLTTARITLPTGEIVAPGRGFKVVATTNAEPDSLPAGIADRFAATIEVRAVHPKALERLPAAWRTFASGTVLRDEHSKRIGLRAWLVFHELTAKGMILRDAARVAFKHQADDVITGLRLASHAAVPAVSGKAV